MKRLLTLTLALVMSLSLTACGGSDDDASSSDVNDVSTSVSEPAEDGSGDASVPEGRISDEKLAELTLGTVGTALTEDISMLDGADVDALIASLSDELPGALVELKDHVSVPYEG